jgi:AraC-like DNA-binding protein
LNESAGHKIRDVSADRLKACARKEAPTRLFPAAEHESIDYRRWYPMDDGAVEANLLTLGGGLTYLRVAYDASAEGGVLAFRADGDAFKFCFNFSDRAVASYKEGLPVSLHFPGEVQLQTLTVMADLVPPETHARFACLLTTGSFMRELAEDLRLPVEIGPSSKPSPQEPWVISTPIPAEVHQALTIMEACPLQGRLRQLYMEGKSLEIIASLLARMCPDAEITQRAASIRPREVRKMHEAHDILRSRIDDLPSLRELARAVGMSTTAFKNAYRAVFGMPVYEHARNERLALARTLLARGELSVSEVADRVGYQSLSWFGAAFKRQFGLLPSEVWPRTVKELSSTDNVAG